MKRKKRNLPHRILAMLLVIVLVVGTMQGAVPLNVLAQESVSGNAVENVPQEDINGNIAEINEAPEAEITAGSESSDWILDVEKNGATPAEEHKHNDVTFTAWTKTDSLPTAPGNYYLTDNVTLSGTWTVPSGTTSICLNGKTIRAEGKCRVITIMASNTLNLYDCTGSGIITGGQKGGVSNRGIFHMYGGRISENNTSTDTGAGIYSNGEFYLHGGEISNNTTAYYGGGVYNKGTFYMYGGRIADNTAGIYGGGVENGSESTFYMYDGEITGNRAKLHGGVVNDTNGNCYLYGGIICGNSITDTDKTGAGVQHQGRSMTVGGSIVIKDNTNGNGESSNLYIQVTRIISIDSSIPLTEGAYIGITSQTVPTEKSPFNITRVNNADYSKYFHSDNASYVIVDSKDHQVQLALPHTHNLTLTPAKPAACTEDGNTAYYVCGGNDGCGKWFSDAAGTQEITDQSSVVISKTGHTYETAWGYQTAEGHAHECQNCDVHDTVCAHTPGAAATAETPQTCTVCGYIIAPAIGHIHNLTLTPAKPAACTEEGNTAYYVCGGNDGCGKWFLDAAGTQEITDKSSVVISATGHTYETAWGYQTADGHAHECQNCDAHDTVVAHTPGAAATAATPQTCTVCGYIIAPATGTEPATGTVIPEVKPEENVPVTGISVPAEGTEPATGTVIPEVKPGENAPATSISIPPAELEDILLTEDEKQQVQNGTNIRIVLEVQDAGSIVSELDRNGIQQALDGFTVGQYLNIDLYKLVGESRTDINETAKKIRIVITVPESLKTTDSSMTRAFAVIRVHDGRADVLNDVDNSADTITIETDRFSTYAVVYKDTSNGGNGNGGGQNQKDDEPVTGDNTPLEMYATLAMIFGFSNLLFIKKSGFGAMTEERKKELVARLIMWGKKGGKLRRYAALAVIMVLAVYYHAIGKNIAVEWNENYEG